MLVEWDDGTQDVVVPLSDRLVGMTAVRRDEDGIPHLVSRRAVRVLDETEAG
jgi:hypothetical protein